MKTQPTIALETQPSPETYPTMAAVINAIDTYPNLSAPRKVEMRRDVEAFCGWLQRSPDMLPADAPRLRRLSDKLHPAQLSITPKRFANVRANVTAALSYAQKLPRSAKPIQNLSPAWAELWSRLHGTWLGPKLSPLFRYADAVGIAPEEINDAVVEAYAAYRLSHSLKKDPQRTITDTRTAWNNAVRDIPGWPQTRLTLGRKENYLLPWSSFPKSFRDDVDRYIETARGLDQTTKQHEAAASSSEASAPVGRYRRALEKAASTNDRKDKLLAAATAHHHRETIRLAASTLVREGEKSVDELIDIKSVISVDTLAIVADSILARNGEPTEYGWTVGKRFRTIALRWLGASAEEISDYNDLLREIKEDGVVNGMTLKNREALRQFDDPAAFGRLVNLPEDLFSKLERQRKRSDVVSMEMALEAEAAVAVMILLTLPVRRGTLGRTNITSNIRWPVGKAGGTGTLYYTPKEETKTSTSPSAILQPWKIDILRLYRRYYQPVLRGGFVENNYLFPSPMGNGPKTVGALSSTVTKAVLKHTGLRVNLHLYRHLAAVRILADNPENMALVRALLGHTSNSKHTLKYAELAAQWAATHLEMVVERELAKDRPNARSSAALRRFRV